MSSLQIKISAIVFTFFLLIFNTFFIVDQRKQALILQFGKVIKTVNTAGISHKIPLVQNAIFLIKELLILSCPSKKLLLPIKKDCLSMLLPNIK